MRAWRRGDPVDEDELAERVYGELHRMARRFFRGERRDHTLQPTVLVHEAYLRLADQRRVDWRNREQFYALAARMMRRVLVDHARSRGRQRRGGDREVVSLEDVTVMARDQPPVLLALDDALAAFARRDPVKALVVELRVFGGFSVRETADILDLSEPTITRHWRFARAWLYKELSVDDPDASSSAASNRSSSAARSAASSGRSSDR